MCVLYSVGVYIGFLLVWRIYGVKFLIGGRFDIFGGLVWIINVLVLVVCDWLLDSLYGMGYFLGWFV